MEETRLRFGALVNDRNECKGDAEGHVAFGLEGEVEELKKGGLYY